MLLIVAGLGLGGAGCGDGDSGAAGNETPTSLVNPFAGTDAGAPDFGTGGGAGNTFPGAVAPFGMLQWSPDTTPSKTNFGGGYSYTETQIRGFSLTHFSGVGCPIMQDVPILPTTVPVTQSPAVAKSYRIVSDYVPTFSHHGEVAEPGYYRVVLDEGTDRAVEVELTATTRGGLGRFTFAPTASASLLFNAGGSAMANGDAVFAVDPERRQVSGWVESGQFCYQRDRYKVYFVAEFDRPFGVYGTWTKQSLAPGTTAAADHADRPFQLRPTGGPAADPPTTSTGAQAGAYVTFDTRNQRAVQVRVAISFVGVDNARENLTAEVSGWSLAAVRAQASRAWADLLGRVQVRGGTEADRRTFYTMLYHAFLGPTVFSDVNGAYPGMDGQVHTDASRTQYTTFSGWDIYRSEIALLALVVPERVADMMQSLVNNAHESGWLPRWSVAADHTNVMVGDPAAPIIASAHALGVTGFDRDAALAAMVKGGTQSTPDSGVAHIERQGLADYLALGYVPHDGTERSSGASTSMFGDPYQVWGSAATTLEYVTDDFAVARFAADLSDAATCETFRSRADNWRRLVNPASGYVQPRYADGHFLSPFDPASTEGFVEGNAAQYTWMVPHDVAGLAGALGGRDAAAAHLDEFFTNLNAGTDAPFAFLSNEPSALTPWIYNWLGRASRGQDVIRRALLTLFGDGPGGYPGNDDVGQMSSWYVFGALGFYPAIPGTDVLVIGSPLFPEVSLRLPTGTIRLTAPQAGRKRPYVTGVRVNGRELTRSWLLFREIRGGATVAFDLAATPSPTWGRAPEDVPPSFGPDARDTCGSLSP